MCKFPDWYRRVEYCRVPSMKQFIPQGYILKLTEYQSILAKRVYLLNTLHFSTGSVHWNEWNNCSYLKQTPARLDVFFLMSTFRLYPGLKMSFKHNSIRKNLFLSACFCWDSRFSLREMNQEFKFGGLIGYGNSCLDSVFRYPKVFTLHAILHDAAGAVRAHSG